MIKSDCRANKKAIAKQERNDMLLWRDLPKVGVNFL